MLGVVRWLFIDVNNGVLGLLKGDLVNSHLRLLEDDDDSGVDIADEVDCEALVVDVYGVLCVCCLWIADRIEISL